MSHTKDSAPTPGIGLLELLEILVKRKAFVAVFTLTVSIASIIYVLMLPNIFCSTAKVLPPQKDTSMGLSSLLNQSGGLAGLAAGSFGGGSDLYVGILKSQSVEDAVATRLGLAKVYGTHTLEATRGRLEATVRIQAGKEGIISIAAEDTDPKRAAMIANTFVDELSRTTVRLNLSKAGSERVFLEKRLDVVKRDLKAAEDDMKEFSQRTKMVQADSQAKASIEGVSRLRADLASKEVQLATLQATKTNESPEVRGLLMGIQRLRHELSGLSGTNEGDGIPSLGNVPSMGLEYSRKLRELKTQEAIFEQLTKQYELAKINEAKDSSSIQILDEALPPVNKSKPKRSVFVTLSAVTAFWVSIFLVLAYEMSSRISETDKEAIKNIRKNILTWR